MDVEISLLFQEIQLEEQYITLTLKCKEVSVASSVFIW